MELVASLFSGDSYNSGKKLMDVAAMRHAAIASNIANVSTPGYKRVDVSQSFEDELRARIHAGDSARIAEAQPHTGIDSLTPSTRADGNNVQIDRELLALTTNTSNFDALVSFTSGSIKHIKMAITGRPQ
jgi:flagellar basal-body rod protein FlgB